MNTSDPSQLDELSTTEELTAYLDGEVDAEHARRIEERLARDEGYRRQLQGLQRTWDMLDQLPQARVDEAFLKSTIEMVAQAAAEDVRASQQSIPRKRNRRWLLAGLGFGCAAAIGFLIGGYLWPDADRQVLENLPLIDDYDVYQMPNPDHEFAAALLKAGLFLEDADSKEPIPDDIRGRRDWVAARPAGKQDELRRNWKRFEDSSAEQQQSLQSLAAELTADPKRKQLWEIESRYRQWYQQGLKPPQRAELLDLPLEQRVKRISKFREPPLTPDELEAVATWYDDRLRERGDELIPAKEQKEFEAADTDRQRRLLWMNAFRVWQFRGPESSPPFGKEDYDKLRSQLSANAQAPLDAAETTRDKWQVVQHWLWQANFYTYFLTDAEREELRPLRGEELYQQLHDFMSRRAEQWPRGFGRGPGDRPRGPERGPERRRGDDQRRRDERRERDRDERRPASDNKQEQSDSRQPAENEQSDEAAPNDDAPATTNEDQPDTGEASLDKRSSE